MCISRGESTGGISYQWDQGTSSQFPARSCVHVGPSSGSSENSRDSEPTACWILYPRPVTTMCVCVFKTLSFCARPEVLYGPVYVISVSPNSIANSSGSEFKEGQHSLVNKKQEPCSNCLKCVAPNISFRG